MVVLDGKGGGGGGSTLTKRDVEAHDDDPLLGDVTDDDDDGEVVVSEREDDGNDGASLLVVLRDDPAAVRLCALCLLLSFVTGTTVGVVPAVMTERYARLDHGRVGSCAAAAAEDPACARGADDAQEAAAASAFALHGARFLSSAVVGAATDARGRRGALAAGVALAASAPLALAWTIAHESTRPEWYYACDAASGVVYWFGVAVSCAADVVPPEHRAASFGYLVVSRYAAAAVVPFLAVLATPLTVSVLSAAVAVAATVFAYVVVPETSPAARRRKRKNDDDDDDDDRERRDAVRETLSLSVLSSALLRPFRELSVLNRNNYLRLLTVLSFASGLVLSGERTFFVYYLENHLRFTDRDIARFFLFNGVAALLVQGVLVGRAVEALGERRVVLVAFAFGVVHNLQFAVARSRTAVYLAVVGAKITGAAYPTVSAMKAGAVGEEERGRVQGAFFSLTALSEALGPAALQAVYRRTKDRTVDVEHDWRGSLVGPGAMFVAAAALYAVGTIAACALPRRPDTEPRPRRRRRRRPRRNAKTTKI